MRLISSRNRLKIARELSGSEAASIRRYCSIGLQTEPQDSEVVAKILLEMHTGREPVNWLECDCRSGTREDPQPRMTARIRAQGSRHFVRISGDEHLCDLRSFRDAPPRDEVPLGEDASGEWRPRQPSRPIGNPLDYLDNASSPGGMRPARTPLVRDPGAGARRLPRLGRILHTLLEQAQFARVRGEELVDNTSLQGPWTDRIAAFAATELISDGLVLGDMLATAPWTKPEDLMRRVEGLTSWPARKKRSAFLVFVADEVSSTQVTKHTSRNPVVITPEKGVRIGGRDQHFSNPPYWVIAVVDRDENNVARVREAYAQHAYNRHIPIPLDSSYERITLKLIQEVLSWLQKKGIPILLTKPLFDSEVTQNLDETASCRADFELEVNSGGANAPKRILIETMGSDSLEYLSQKASTHALMRLRGALIKHEFHTDGKQDERDDALRRRIYGQILTIAGQ